jgi:hypothetical protein
LRKWVPLFSSKNLGAKKGPDETTVFSTRRAGHLLCTHVVPVFSARRAGFDCLGDFTCTHRGYPRLATAAGCCASLAAITGWSEMRPPQTPGHPLAISHGACTAACAAVSAVTPTARPPTPSVLPAASTTPSSVTSAPSPDPRLLIAPPPPCPCGTAVLCVFCCVYCAVSVVCFLLMLACGCALRATLIAVRLGLCFVVVSFSAVHCLLRCAL